MGVESGTGQVEDGGIGDSFRATEDPLVLEGLEPRGLVGDAAVLIQGWHQARHGAATAQDGHGLAAGHPADETAQACLGFAQGQPHETIIV